jgi:UDP-N-acetylglucosamine--N-acetylmuramyl-(pentapeptide) pyrophosphoryl-undecaprenol N-acetylglucosamine transferase
MTTLMVASGGGHLSQLVELAPRLRGIDPSHLWVTWDTPQSRTLLSDKEVFYVRPTPPRSPFAVARNLDFAFELWGRQGTESLVTTGSQLVLPFLAVGRVRGKRCHFIESAARSAGPSLTARIASHIPGVQMYTQYRSWPDPGWRYVGSVFDGFECVRSTHVNQTATRFVVTLGTMPKWQFRRLLEACLRVIPPDSEVLWQTGATDVGGLDILARPTVSASELTRATAEADVVISHAGVGSALTAMRCGKCPILVPRDASLQEHVDGHQRQIADELERRGLAIVTTPEELSPSHLADAAGLSITPPTELLPMDLDRYSTKHQP